MKLRILYAMAVLGLVWSATPVYADGICVTGGACNGNWQPWVDPVSHQQGQHGVQGFAYFDGDSNDAANANIAYFIQGQGYFQNDPQSPAAPLPWWGNADGSAVSSFYFTRNGRDEAHSLEFLAGWAPQESLGWYNVDKPSEWGWIFHADGKQPVPSNAEFTPSKNYGLFFIPNTASANSFSFMSPAYGPQADQSFYTQSEHNGIVPADQIIASALGITLDTKQEQHFAVFSDNQGGFYVGAKDRSLQIGDGDYNDLIVHIVDPPAIDAASVPEPASSGLVAIALGLVLVAVGRARRSCRARQ